MLWAIFAIIVIAMLAVDIGLFFKLKHKLERKKAISMSLCWIFLALVFNFFIYLFSGTEPAMQFLTGYVVEKMLSIDNLFLFVVIFSYFQIPEKYQPKILFLGIISALIMRLAFISLGSYLLHNFAWVIYLFAVFLVFIGIQFLRKQEGFRLEKSRVFRFVQKVLPITKDYHEGRFFVKQATGWIATPLFLALVMIEVVDLITAMDSIPAIFVITSDTFIVYTSNIFAILGLRSLYFVISDVMAKLRYLYIGLSYVLIFLGMKILISPWIKVPLYVSLSFVVLAVSSTVFFSLRKPKKEQ